MRKLVFILFVTMVLFMVNLIFYIASEDYRFFIKKIKYSDTVVYEGDVEVNDIDRNPFWVTQEWNTQWTGTIETPDPETLTFIDVVDDEPQEIEMNEIDNSILDMFSEYDLQLLEKHGSMFDITGEYPDEYFEYYSPDVVLYFFPTKSYRQVYDIFDTLSYELPFDINEVNNFWQASFYINLKEVYTDDFVRVIVQYKNTPFWLKIRKDEYNNVKEILDALKPQG